jgi:prepilin-type N-terminal cleavage/methylation domain-containing protein
MTPSKNHSGFTLIEVMAALAVFALVATPIFLLESFMTQKVATSSRRMERLVEAKNFLCDARIAWQKAGGEPQSTQKAFEKKGLTLRYVPKKVSGSSALKAVYSLYQERVTIEWKDMSGKRIEELISFIMVPPPPQKTEKGKP